ncbi:hypothetical protein GCM10010978_04820 [Compostibacillus humi]|uniref:Uncharacterized protein n=1 Tax=Compostibacillus humi TaxID=1245525 RepID=A0A8J2ZPX2_9BACI|nr:hypothetical protein [Compostibacillus humi]GGH70169.1 hypothetical protein GCM10010978_04820 [Compostibacillus humi]HLT54809.1 hypothetical protein [Bacillota bacterium]
MQVINVTALCRWTSRFKGKPGENCRFRHRHDQVSQAGKIAKTGVVPPEELIIGGLFDPFLEELKNKNITIMFKQEAWPKNLYKTGQS